MAHGSGASRRESSELVDALQREIDGLQRAARLRAVIEQAKGMLAERYGETVEQAFDRLTRISQEQNARVVDVAATVLGMASPGESGSTPVVAEQDLPRPARAGAEASAEWLQARDAPGVRSSATGSVIDSLAAVTTEGDAAAALIRDLSGAHVDYVVIYIVRPDDALELLGAVGYSEDVVSAWRRVPLSLETPLAAAVRTGEAVFLASASEAIETYPATRGTFSGAAALAVLPLADGVGPAGVVGLGWGQPGVLDDETRRRLRQLVDRVGPILLRGVVAREAQPTSVVDVLRLLDDPWLVLAGASGNPGSVAELVVEAVAPTWDEGRAAIGQRLLVAFPELGLQTRVADDVTRLGPGDVLVREVPGGTGPWGADAVRVRAVRVGRRALVTWRPTRR